MEWKSGRSGMEGMEGTVKGMEMEEGVEWKEIMEGIKKPSKKRV